MAIPAGTNRKLCVWVWQIGGANGFASCTYDGNAMTAVRLSWTQADGGELDFFEYDVPDTDSGTKTITATFIAAKTNRQLMWAFIENTKVALHEAENGGVTGAFPTSGPSVTTLTNTTENAMLIHGSILDSGALTMGVGTGDVEERNAVVDGRQQHIVSEAVTSVASHATESNWTGGSVKAGTSGAFYARV